MREALSLAKVTKVIRSGERKRYCDGGNLYLQVAAPGAASWLYRWSEDKKQRSIGLGRVQRVPLALTREKAREIDLQLGVGSDPLTMRASGRAAVAEQVTFSEASRRYLAGFKGTMRALELRQWQQSLDHHAAPINDRMVASITVADVLNVLTPIWTDRNETANRVRSRIKRILAWAKVHGFRTGSNPAEWAELSEALPSRKAVRKIVPLQHFSALPYAQLPKFMEALRARDGRIARALEFTIL